MWLFQRQNNILNTNQLAQKQLHLPSQVTNPSPLNPDLHWQEGEAPLLFVHFALA